MASIPHTFNIQEDPSVIPPEAKIKALRKAMVKKIDDQGLKKLLEALKDNLIQLQENLRLLNSVRSVEDLQSCDIELKENSLEKQKAKYIIDHKKQERLMKLYHCVDILKQCSCELRDCRNKLMEQPKHVLNDLCEDAKVKELFRCASNILAELLLTPQIFNPKVQELVQPLIDFLYLFNKIDLTIPHLLQAFEKVKMVVKTTHEICESGWNTFSDSLVHFANDDANKKDFFISNVEVILNGWMAKEILNELEKQKHGGFNKNKVESIFGDLTYVKILSKENIKNLLKQLNFEDVLTDSEKNKLGEDIDRLFKQGGTEKSLSREAKNMVLDVLKNKYFGDLKKTCFAAFIILKFLKLLIERNENGVSKISDSLAISKIENCVSYFMENYFSSKAGKLYYSARANPESNEIEEITACLTKIKITVQLSFERSIMMAADDNTPETYIDQLEKCKDKNNGSVDLKKLFFTLFMDYNKGGLFLLAHPLRHHRNRVDEVRASVVEIVEQGEFIDWPGVLTALETWPDAEGLAYQGSLKKRVQFFKKVIEEIDSIQEVPVAHSMHRSQC